MVDLRPDHLELVKRILAGHVPEYEVHAFGSRVRWTAKETSDLDLVVMTDAPLDLARLADLQEAFSESDLPFRVDVLDWAAIAEDFRRIIEQEYVVIQPGSTSSSRPTWRRSGMVGDLPSTWRLMPLSDCMAAIIDYRGKTPRKTSAGIPLITAKIVKNGRIETPEEFIDPTEYEEWMRRGLPERGDVLVTTEAPLGEVAQLRDANVALAQRLITLRGKPGLLDNTFLKFLMQSAFVQEQLKARSSGTTVLGIKQSELRQVSLIVPELVDQQAIACILGTLDDKIELSRRMNETLEAMARAIFKSWFVDFDPVRAKAAGQQPSGLAPHIADLFPAEFEESGLGKIPRGWRVGTFGEVARNPRRGVSPSELDPGTPYIALEHMPRRRIALDQWGFADDVASNKFRFRRGEILFGKLRPYFHKVGIAPTDGVCSTDILVVVPSSQEWFGFVMGHISSVEFVNHTDATSMGTKMPRTNWSDMSRYEIVIPDEAVADAFSRLVHPVVERIIANIQETRSLTALRDTLLPKLISGELRVSNAERYTEARI